MAETCILIVGILKPNSSAISWFDLPRLIWPRTSFCLLDNGLVRRVFLLDPNVSCISYTNLSSGQELLRSIEPEARLVFNGTSYNVGGLSGQKEKAYLRLEVENNLQKKDSDFVFTNYSISDIKPFIHWKPTTWLTNPNQAKGKTVTLEFISNLPALKNIMGTAKNIDLIVNKLN